MEWMRRVLLERYGLRVHGIKKTAGGWSAEAYVARGDGADFFVKAYDMRRASVRPWVERMAGYMPVVLWLHAQEALRERMVAPLETLDGAYSVETGPYVLLVFPFLRGVTIATDRLDAEQVRQLAEILAALHGYGAEVPVPTGTIREGYALPFLDRLAGLSVEGDGPDALWAVLGQYDAAIREGSWSLRAMADSLRGRDVRNVLCHTDVHGWNLMWTDVGRLVLIDWEGLRLAPAEADLFSFTPGFFFDYAGDAFMAAYRGMRAGYREDAEAMRFYRLRRRMEDLADFALSVARDGLGEAEMTEALGLMARECEGIRSCL